MRSSRIVLATAAVAALIAGCGNRHLVLNVDVLSYMNPNVTHAEFGPVPPVPGGVYTGEQEIVKDVEVNLVEGTNDVAKVESVSLKMTTIVEDSTGAGEDTLRVYMSDTSVDPMSTPPVVVMPITLVEGQSDTVTVDLAGDTRVAELFTSKRMRMTMTTALRGPSSGNPLNGRFHISALDATLIAGRKSN